jgi:hypothetical protein
MLAVALIFLPFDGPLQLQSPIAKLATPRTTESIQPETGGNICDEPDRNTDERLGHRPAIGAWEL